MHLWTKYYVIKHSGWKNNIALFMKHKTVFVVLVIYVIINASKGCIIFIWPKNPLCFRIYTFKPPSNTLIIDWCVIHASYFTPKSLWELNVLFSAFPSFSIFIIFHIMRVKLQHDWRLKVKLGFEQGTIIVAYYVFVVFFQHKSH